MEWNTYANDDDFAFELTSNVNNTANVGGFNFNPNSAFLSGNGIVYSRRASVSTRGFYYPRPSAGLHHYVFTLSQSSTSDPVGSMYIDGVKQTCGAVLVGAGFTNPFANSTLYLFSRNNASLFGEGKIAGLAFWDWLFDDAAAKELYASGGWDLYQSDPRRLYFSAGASGGDTSLIFSDSTQTQTTDVAVLVTSSFLVVQEATQNHTSENVVLDASVSTNLIVADATQTHTSENSALQVSTNLGIDDSTQSQTSNNIALTSVHSLIIQECIQDQNSENIALDSGLILTVADCIQGQTAENVSILASSLLLINDATQEQTAENLSFTLATNISVNNSVHSISSESPNLTIPGSGTGATVEEIVDGIMAALLAETIPVNIKKINDVLVYGIGTDGNPWRESA